MQPGKPAEPVEKVNPGSGTTERETVFTEPWTGGGIIASVDIAITTESADLTGTVGTPFATTAGVSVDIDASEQYDYKSYTLSLDVTGLPEWLKPEDKMLFENVPLASHDFTLKLSGTPTAMASAKAVTVSATVTVAGVPILIASGDKTVTVAAYLNAEREYEPVILAEKPSGDGDDNPDSPTSNKDSGGGCDAGFGGMALLALLGLIAKKRRGSQRVGRLSRGSRCLISVMI